MTKTTTRTNANRTAPITLHCPHRTPGVASFY